jgi:hypothetical protein
MWQLAASDALSTCLIILCSEQMLLTPLRVADISFSCARQLSNCSVLGPDASQYPSRGSWQLQLFLVEV